MPNANIIHRYYISRGLRQCVEKGLNSILIEGDALILINTIKNGATPNWKIQRILRHIMDALNKDPDYEVRHVFREVNMAVDYMENIGIHLRTKDDQVFEAIPSEDLEQILVDDYEALWRQKKKALERYD
ncbi:hypothetical protein SUGI_0531050 [Cryptomeria japonica]|nr:hypothetical protein SUGI_0531050 [Cryptomeria japonica]